MIPTRSGEIPHSAACCRTQVTAANPSATAKGLMLFMASRYSSVYPRTMARLSWVASFTGTHQAIFQNECGHAFRGQILGNFSTFSRDGQGQ